MPLERAVLGWEIDAEVRPATLLSRERALGDEPSQEMGGGAEPLETGGIADEAAVRPDGMAELAGDGFLSRCLRVDRPGSSAYHRLVERCERRPPAEDETFEQRVRRQPVRPVDAGCRALARGIETRELGAAREVRHDAADRVVSRRRNRNRHLGRVVTRPLERSHEGREAAAVDGAEVEEDRPLRGDLASDDVSRRQLVGEALTPFVEEDGAFAAESLGEKE